MAKVKLADNLVENGKGSPIGIVPVYIDKRISGKKLFNIFSEIDPLFNEDNSSNKLYWILSIELPLEIELEVEEVEDDFYLIKSGLPQNLSNYQIPFLILKRYWKII